MINNARQKRGFVWLTKLKPYIFNFGDPSMGRGRRFHSRYFNNLKPGREKKR